MANKLARETKMGGMFLDSGRPYITARTPPPPRTTTHHVHGMNQIPRFFPNRFGNVIRRDSSPARQGLKQTSWRLLNVLSHRFIWWIVSGSNRCCLKKPSLILSVFYIEKVICPNIDDQSGIWRSHSPRKNLMRLQAGQPLFMFQKYGCIGIKELWEEKKHTEYHK